MSPDGRTAPAEMDESAWVYLAAHHRDDELLGSQPFAELLSHACERLGFAVFPTESANPAGDPAPPHWVDAVKHADVCIIDLGVSSAVAGAELALAYCSGRPIVALRARHE